MLLEIENRQNIRVVQRLDDLELTSRCPLAPLALFLRRGLGDRVLPHQTEHVVERGVVGEAVLVPGSIEDQVAQDVVADSSRPLRRSNAHLFHRAGESLRHPDVDHGTRIRVDARTFPIDDGGEDALLFGACLGLGAILQEHAVAGVAGEIALNIVGGKKDEGVQPGETQPCSRRAGP